MDKHSLEYKIKKKTANTNNKTKRLCDKAKGLAGKRTPCAWSQQRRCPLKMLSNVGTTELHSSTSKVQLTLSFYQARKSLIIKS